MSIQYIFHIYKPWYILKTALYTQSKEDPMDQRCNPQILFSLYIHIQTYINTDTLSSMRNSMVSYRLRCHKDFEGDKGECLKKKKRFFFFDLFANLFYLFTFRLLGLAAGDFSAHSGRRDSRSGQHICWNVR